MKKTSTNSLIFYFDKAKQKNMCPGYTKLKMEKIYGMHKLVGLQLFGSGTPTFSIGTPTFCQMGVLNSCFQNPSESSGSKTILGEVLVEIFNSPVN